MRSISLSVLHRITILGVLPKEGNILTLRVLRDLQRELSFAGEELDALAFQDLPDGRLQWKADGDVRKEIVFTGAALTLIREALAELDKSGKMTLPMLEIGELLAVVGDGATA